MYMYVLFANKGSELSQIITKEEQRKSMITKL